MVTLVQTFGSILRNPSLPSSSRISFRGRPRSSGVLTEVPREAPEGSGDKGRVLLWNTVGTREPRLGGGRLASETTCLAVDNACLGTSERPRYLFSTGVTLGEGGGTSRVRNCGGTGEIARGPERTAWRAELTATVLGCTIGNGWRLVRTASVV